VGLRYPEELGHLSIAQIHSLKVRPYPFSKTSPWCITGLRNKNGKRARLFFKTKSDATAELDRIKIKFRDTVFNHYREIVKPEEAERYWNIFPTVLAANVVPIAAEA